MDLLRQDIKSLYFKYLSAAFGSAMISSIYAIVDMAMVGQYQGPDGTAALAVVAPIWNLIYSLGLLTGIGGSVLFSTLKGQQQKGGNSENEYFTASLTGTAAFALISWLLILFLDAPLLRLFGADEALLPLAQEYLLPIKFVIPFFVFNQMLAAFLRNDRNPGLATAAVLSGGILNIIGDYLFVFPLGMGIMGAGLATALGAALTFIVLLSHFFTSRNSLRIVKVSAFPQKLNRILVMGFSTFFIDVAMGILTMFFNRQIMKYSGSAALSVYGIIVNVSTVVQCCAYSVGQAAQPILSINYGAGKRDRVHETLKYALCTAGFVSHAWTLAILVFPNGFTRIFMNPTAEVLKMAPPIIRSYGISFLLLPFNIFSTYYFQALMKPKVSFLVSVSRGLVISGILIYVLPVLAGVGSLWFAMPITELLVFAYVVYSMKRYS